MERPKDTNEDVEGLEPEEEARLARQMNKDVEEALEEEGREHDIRWIPPSPDDEKLPE